MNQPPPVQTAAAATTALTQKVGNLIRYWVHYDTMIAGLNKQLRQVREARTAYEAQILQQFQASGFPNPVIETNSGRILVAEDRHTQPLTFKSLETLLHQYYRQKPPGSRDETADVLKFIRAQREVTVSQCLKRVAVPAAAAGPPPPPPANQG